MASVDLSSYVKQDVAVQYGVGKGKNRFVFTRSLSTNKLQIRRYEIYPFETDNFVAGIFLVTGDLMVVLPSPTKSFVTVDFVAFSGADLKLRGFNEDGKYIGYCHLSSRASASIRRATLNLPLVKFLYFADSLEYLLVSIFVDETPKRRLADIREITDLATFLDSSRRLLGTSGK